MPPFDPALLRRAREATPLRPYEALMPEDDPERAGETVERGWRLGSFPAVPLRPPIHWDEVCASNRSWHYHLHCWDGLGPLLAAHSRDGAAAWLRFAGDAALDWARSFTSLKFASPFAWYDMAVGLRAYKLGYLLDAAARSRDFSDEEVEVLARSAILHREALDEERRFASHSNHGLYQAAGHLALARRLPELSGMAAAAEVAARRLEAMVDAQFTQEGVHREHSPHYHLHVVEVLRRVERAGLAGGLLSEQRLDEIEERLAWFVQPNGAFAMFGDSDHRFRPTPGLAATPELRFVASGGAEGTPAADNVRGFPESGYAVLRDRWPEGSEDFADCSYLAHMCGFHSTAHKHADDLTFVWYDAGRELLTDSGRFGYAGRTEPGSDLWDQGFHYSDPRRVYVESTRAHNTVEVDGRSHPRRDVQPYGSALQAWGETDATLYSLAEVARGQLFHRRLLVLHPGKWLLVIDRLRDATGRRHAFDQRFHFAPELSVEMKGAAIGVAADEGTVLQMITLVPAEPLELVRGRGEPHLLGWISRTPGTMEPAWTGGYAHRGAAEATFATLFSLTVQQLAADHEATDPVEGRFGWREGGLLHALAIAETGDSIDVHYTPEAGAATSRRSLE